MEPDVPTIRTERLELVSMGIGFMQALAAHDLAAAEREIGAVVPEGLWVGLENFLSYRLAQLEVDPAIRPWLGRAMVLTDAAGVRRVIGTLGFHGPPDEEGRVEVGYRIQPDFRRRGLTREAVIGLFDWAATEQGIHRFVASVGPDNQASLGLIRGLGFVQTGSQIDEIDGLELVHEARWPRSGSPGGIA